MKISRYKIIMLCLFVGLVVLVQYAKRDINLNVDLLRESLMKMPGLIVENIQMTREISGDYWRVKVPYLEQEGTALKMRSLDIRRTISGDKGEWLFFGHDGIYSNDEKEAAINNLVGNLENDGLVWKLESPRLDWDERTSIFLFPRGLKIYNDELILTTTEASIDKQGMILLRQGGVIQWTKFQGQ